MQQVLHARGTVFDTVAHIVSSPIVMRQIVPQSDFLTFKHVPGCNQWHTDAITMIVTTNTDPDNIYQATGQSLYDAFWRTLCCDRSARDATERPIDDSGYVAWRRLIDLQQACYDVDLECRRLSQHHKRLVCGFTSIVISALTYRMRRHKLLFIMLPFSLPPLIQFISKTYDAARDLVLSTIRQNYLQQSAQVQIEQRDFENANGQWTQGRQFAVTASGLMGWVPVAARVGDNIGLFAGCRVPFVMRAFQEGYKIVGDAYVHGVMDGEGEASNGEMLKIL
jgi:starch phosphorylase